VRVVQDEPAVLPLVSFLRSVAADGLTRLEAGSRG
jgi:hypothetical protein